MNHGHVIPNADGSKARCGGPAVCPDCAREAAATGTLLTEAEYQRYKAQECAFRACVEALELVQAHGSLGREARETVDAALALARAADSPTTEGT